MPLLKDMPVGERILIALIETGNPPRTAIGFCFAGTSRKIAGTILRPYSASYGAILAWKNGEEQPQQILSPITLTQSEQNNGFVNAYAYNGDCEVEKCTDQTLTITAQLCEKSCKQCSKKNDIGVKFCWWCVAPNPTN